MFVTTQTWLYLQKDDKTIAVANFYPELLDYAQLTGAAGTDEFRFRIQWIGVSGISQGTVYSLMKQPDFPLIQFGKRMLVSRERFFEWLESRTQHLEEDGTYGKQSWDASGEHQETHRRPL